MSHRRLLDTDIFSEILKGVDENVVTRATRYFEAVGMFTISTITVMEIVKGLHKVRREPQIELLVNDLQATEVLSLDTPSAILAGRVFADLERTGQTIGRADSLIAGIALANRLPLITGNVNHFQRIRKLGYGLELENWREPT